MSFAIHRSELDGAWIPISARVSGQELEVGQLRVARFVLDRGCYEIFDHARHVVDRGDIRVDESAMPRAMDIVGLEGPHAGKTMLAIFELDGDRLTVCYDLEHMERPLTMQPLEDQLLLVITYERAAPLLS